MDALQASDASDHDITWFFNTLMFSAFYDAFPQSVNDCLKPFKIKLIKTNDNSFRIVESTAKRQASDTENAG